MYDSERCDCKDCTPQGPCRECPSTDTDYCVHCGMFPAGSGHWSNHKAIHHPLVYDTIAVEPLVIL